MKRADGDESGVRKEKESLGGQGVRLERDRGGKGAAGIRIPIRLRRL